MSEIRFSGIVEEDMTDLDEEVFVRAGERVYGNLNYYGETPYIFGEIEDVDSEYVAPEFWVPVLPESLEAEIFGAKIPFARLRELAEAERNGTNWIMPCKCGDTVYRIVGQKGKKRVGSRTVLSVTKYDTSVSVFTTVSDILGKTVFLTQAEATRALAATDPKGDAKT